jgi:4-hydroxy-tetrahydrodipicolinate synthase
VAFYNGSNPLALAAFAAGATGWCTAAPNLIPELNLDLYQAVAGNNYEAARDIFYRQLRLLQFIVSKGLPRAIKAGLKLKGIDAGYLRSPLQPLTAEETEQLQHILRECATETV